MLLKADKFNCEREGKLYSFKAILIKKLDA